VGKDIWGMNNGALDFFSSMCIIILRTNKPNAAPSARNEIYGIISSAKAVFIEAQGRVYRRLGRINSKERWVVSDS